MTNTSSERRRWSEAVSVALAVVAAAFMFFEIIRSQLPSNMQVAIEQPSGTAAWVAAAALGLALLCSGIGVIAISTVRLLIALRKGDASHINAAAKDQLSSVAIVVVGFVLAAVAFFMLSQMQP